MVQRADNQILFYWANDGIVWIRDAAADRDAGPPAATALLG